MRNKKLVLSMIILTVMLCAVIPGVSAADMFGGLFDNLLDTIFGMLGKEINMPNIVGQPNEETHTVGMLIATFLIFFTIFFALSMRIPIFTVNGEFRRSVAIAFSVGVAGISLFTPGLMGMMKNIFVGIGTFAASALWIAFLVLLIYLVIASFRGAGQMGSEAAAGASRASAEAHRERGEDVRAKRDADRIKYDSEQEEALENMEDAHLSQAEKFFTHIRKTTGDEVARLRAILRTIQMIISARDGDEAGAAQRKEALGRRIAAVAAEISHNAQDLRRARTELERVRQENTRLDGLIKNGQAAETDLNAAIKGLAAGATLMPRGTPVATAQADMNALNTELHNSDKLAHEVNTYITNVENQIGAVENQDPQAAEEINQMVGAIHENNYPAALQHCQTAINIKTNISKEITRDADIIKQVKALIKQLSAMTKAIEAHTKTARSHL